MTQESNLTSARTGLILVLGGTGKTGRRIAERLSKKGVPTRLGSRAGLPRFEWNDASTWDECLAGVEAVYVNYAPDLAVPGATESIEAFVARAKGHGVARLVLLSGRGETEAEACEQIVQRSGIEWTIVRASWFNQNFSEGPFLEMVRAGKITLPAGAIADPFIDVDDIAEVVVAALTEVRHGGEIYEVTGPRLLTFAEVASEIAAASGRAVSYVDLPLRDFTDGLTRSGAPAQMVWLMDYLFTTVLDGRNAYVSDGVERALGRRPKDFREYARAVATTGLWRDVA
mgnify:CR=1 FL=1